MLAAIIWGSAFIFQKMGMDHIGPFTFGAFRFILGSLPLLVVILIAGKVNDRKPLEERTEITPWTDKSLLVGGLLCGIGSFAGASLQQIGLVYTTAGKAGFLTSLDIIIVPFFMLFLRQKVSKITWLGVAVALFGAWMLSVTDGFTIEIGDAFVMGCALAYSFQIMFIDHYAEKVDPLKLAFIQFLITGLLSVPFALIFETIELQAIIACAGPILYVAFMEVTLAFTLQVVGQKYTPAASAAIIMSLESVFAVICGALFLGEMMTGRELTGCVIMFAAFIITQIPDMMAKPEDEEAESEDAQKA